jgi:hypothetical protein
MERAEIESYSTTSRRSRVVLDVELSDGRDETRETHFGTASRIKAFDVDESTVVLVGINRGLPTVGWETWSVDESTEELRRVSGGFAQEESAIRRFSDERDELQHEHVIDELQDREILGR